MNDLLMAAGIDKSRVDYISCHATGTHLGDLEEFRAIESVFGSNVHRLKVNAPKSMLGHTCFASPIVETIGAVLQMNAGRLHPSINIDNIDPEMDGRIDICANHAVDHSVDILIKNSFGFGGLNCSSLIARYQE